MAYKCQNCGKLYMELANPKDRDSMKYCPTCYEAIQKSREEQKEELNARPSLNITKHGVFDDPDKKVVSFVCHACKCEWELDKTDCDLSRDSDGKLKVSSLCPECLSEKTTITKVVTIREASSGTGDNTSDQSSTTAEE